MPLRTKGNGDFDLLDAEIKQINKQIQGLYERRQLLHQKRNGLVTINCLPEEILAEVFKLAGRSWKSVTPSMRLLWVCQWWRKVGLGCTSLWTWIGEYNSTQLSRWLTLSKSSSLHINIVDLPSLPSTFTRSLFGALSRIQTMRLAPARMDSDLRFFWVDHPRRLEALGLEGVTLPTSALAQASSLRHLFLGRCTFRWEPCPLGYPQLTSLHVIDPRDLIPMTTLIHLLAWMPELDVLVLINALQESPFTEPIPINGPKLSRLQILTKNVESCIQFLELTSCIGKKTQAILDLAIDTIDDGHIRRTLGRIDSICCAGTRRVSQIELWGYSNIRIDYLDLVEDPRKIKGIHLILTNSGVDPLASWTRNATLLSNVLSLNDLRSLHVSDHETQQEANYYEPLIQLFGSLPHLLDLQVYTQSSLYGFLRALTTSDSDRGSAMVFPALRRFGQLDLHFGQDDAPQALLSFMQGRVNRGQQLNSLVFRSATGWAQVFSELGRLGVKALEAADFDMIGSQLEYIPLRDWTLN